MKKVSCVAVVLALTGLTSCVGSSDPSTPTQEASASPRALSVSDVKLEAQRLEAQLGCKQVVQLEDDIWFWDRAVGILCENDDGQIIRMLVYQTPGSAVKSAVEHGLRRGEAVIVKGRLFISGDANALLAISRETPGLPKPQMGEIRGKASTAAEDDAMFCVRAVSAHAMLTIEGGKEPRSDIADLDGVIVKTCG